MTREKVFVPESVSAHFAAVLACRLTLLTALLSVLLAADTPKEAAQRVREGIELFGNGRFSEAEAAFSEAAKLAPENPTIMFDEACAALAAGEVDQARELFSKAAQPTDPDLTTKAYYNLGGLEAERAREMLGEDPTAAEGETREKSIDLLLAAVGHYREVLRFQPAHQNARHNLELIRVFIKHIQSQWDERDKQKARDEKNLLQFLKMIEDRQIELRSATKLFDSEDDSAPKRKALRQMSNQQSELQEEVAPLKEKITQQIQTAGQQNAVAGQPSVSEDQSQEMEQMLNQLADDAGAAMLKAADALETTDFATADSSQADVLEQLNQIYLVVAPYQDILQRSIREQQGLVPQESEADAENDSPEETQPDEQPDALEADRDGLAMPEQTQETQSRITDWARMLSLKAEAELPRVEQQLDSIPQSASEVSATVEEPETEIKDGDDDDAEEASPELPEAENAAEPELDEQQQQRKQLQGLLKSMELAVELAPDAEQHSRAAVRLLTDDDPIQAESEQRETLRILNEIAEPLVKNQDDQKQNQKNDQNQEQDDKQQQQKQDTPDDKQEQEKSQEDQPQPQEDQKSQKESDQERKNESQKQQAESVLSQARERERQRREMEKQLREILMRGIRVEKDW